MPRSSKGTIGLILQWDKVGNQPCPWIVSFLVLGDDQLRHWRFDGFADLFRLSAGDMVRTGVKLAHQPLAAPTEGRKVNAEGISFQVEIVMQMENVGTFDAGHRFVAVTRPVEIPVKRPLAIGGGIHDDESCLPRGVALQGADYPDRAAGKRRQRKVNYLQWSRTSKKLPKGVPQGGCVSSDRQRATISSMLSGWKSEVRVVYLAIASRSGCGSPIAGQNGGCRLRYIASRPGRVANWAISRAIWTSDPSMSILMNPTSLNKSC